MPGVGAQHRLRMFEATIAFPSLVICQVDTPGDPHDKWPNIARSCKNPNAAVVDRRSGAAQELR